MQFRKLSQRFYLQSALLVAQRLPGKFLIRKYRNELLIGKIVEAEAYCTPYDEASHAYGGKKNRNAVMFNKGGTFYVYFTYGNHFLCNVVTGKKGIGEAALIRAIEPIQGIETMLRNRYGRITANEKDLINLTNGPGKLTQALAINGKQNGVSLLDDEIYIVYGSTNNEKIMCSPRIGISRSKELPWRFYIDGNKFVSRR